MDSDSVLGVATCIVCAMATGIVLLVLDFTKVE